MQHQDMPRHGRNNAHTRTRTRTAVSTVPATHARDAIDATSRMHIHSRRVVDCGGRLESISHTTYTYTLHIIHINAYAYAHQHTHTPGLID